MTKTIHTTSCFVVVLSSLLSGCAKNLPELPIDVTNTRNTTQTANVASSISQLNPIINSEVNFEENDSQLPLEFVAKDLVKALSFISGMSPELTSIVTASSGSEFNNLVKESMLQQGYRFDNKRLQSGSRQLTTSYLEINRELQPSELTAIMAINSVLIKRTYEIQNDSIEPKSAYFIRGINPELVDSNEQVRML